MIETTKRPSASYESMTSTVRELINSVSKGEYAETTTVQPKPEVVVLRTQPKISVPRAFSSLDDFASELIAEDNSFSEKLSSARKLLSEALTGSTDSIKARRMNLGLSQKEVADMIGTSQPHIARIEKNPSCMMFETAIKLSAALQIDVADMAALAGLGMRNE